MKFIIFISDNIRHGNFPRLDGFSYSSEHGLYLYGGRELTIGEFNDAAKIVFSPDFRNQGFSFLAQAVGPELEAQIAKDQAEAEAAAAIAAEPAAPVEPESFHFEGRQIHLGDERVAGLFGDEDQLRVRAEHAELRPAIEAWLESQPTQ